MFASYSNFVYVCVYLLCCREEEEEKKVVHTWKKKLLCIIRCLLLLLPVPMIKKTVPLHKSVCKNLNKPTSVLFI